MKSAEEFITKTSGLAQMESRFSLSMVQIGFKAWGKKMDQVCHLS